MAYIECPKCHQRALSIATQCPRCGQEFLTEHPKPLVEEPEGRPQLRLMLAVGGALLGGLLLVALAVMLVVAVVRRHSSSDGLAPPPVLSASPDSAPVIDTRDSGRVTAQSDTAPTVSSPPGVQASAKARDSTPPVAPAPSRKKTAPKPRDDTVPAEPAPTPVAPSATAALPAVNGQVQRYAKDWVNVRSRRRPGAHIVRVLNRGQAVMVDSLSEGWWRVMIDGQAVGYVYRAYLDTVPPRPR